jgi:hypothetical protein
MRSPLDFKAKYFIRLERISRMEAQIFGICHFELTPTNFNEIRMIYFIVKGRISLGGDSNAQNGESKGRRQEAGPSGGRKSTKKI